MVLKRLDIQVQAEKFVAYFGRVAPRELPETFREWAESKDFEPSDRHAIWIEIRKLLRGRSRNKG